MLPNPKCVDPWSSGLPANCLEHKTPKSIETRRSSTYGSPRSVSSEYDSKRVYWLNTPISTAESLDPLDGTDLPTTPNRTNRTTCL